MGEVINLNQFRKKRERSDPRRRRSGNRALYDPAKDQRELLPGTRGEDPKTLEDRPIDPPAKTEETPDAS